MGFFAGETREPRAGPEQQLAGELDRSGTDIVDRIVRIGDTFGQRSKPLLAEFDLPHYGFKLLAALRRAGVPFESTPSEPCRALLVPSGTLTNQIDQLSEAGLVYRKPHPRDRRGFLIGLTEEGRRRIERALLALSAEDRSLVAELTEAEQATLVDLLRKMLFSLERGVEESGAAQTKPQKS